MLIEGRGGQLVSIREALLTTQALQRAMYPIPSFHVAPSTDYTEKMSLVESTGGESPGAEHPSVHIACRSGKRPFCVVCGLEI